MARHGRTWVGRPIHASRSASIADKGEEGLPSCSMRPTTSAFLAAGITATIMGGGFAYASIPSSATAVISGCYDTKSGDLRVIDAQGGGKCSAKTETALTWNQQGPKGDGGATGPQGTPGAQGPDGPAGPSSGGTRYYVLTGIADPGPLPDPPTVTSSALFVPAGGLEVRCEAGDVAVAGALTVDVESINTNPVVTNPFRGGNVIISVPVLDAAGAPIGYTNKYELSLSTIVSSSFPPYLAGSRGVMTLVVTCADQTP
jgi:hypothetical protein